MGLGSVCVCVCWHNVCVRWGEKKDTTSFLITPSKDTSPSRPGLFLESVHVIL